MTGRGRARGSRASRVLAPIAASVAFIFAAGAFGACDSASKQSDTTATIATTGAFTAVALGDAASEVVNGGSSIRDTWPQRFYVHALPITTSFVNLAMEGATITDVVAREVPLLRDLHPRVVAMLVGIADIAARTPTQTFAANLRTLLHAVHEAGARIALVATLPHAVGAVDAYNDIVRIEAARAHATLVPLDTVDVSGAADSAAGAFVPDPAGHATIADAYSRAYASAAPPR